jgi:hypothetical protein
VLRRFHAMPLQVAAQAAASDAAADGRCSGTHCIRRRRIGGARFDLFKRQATAEDYRTGYIGLRVNKQYSLQRFLLNITNDYGATITWNTSITRRSTMSLQLGSGRCAGQRRDQRRSERNRRCRISTTKVQKNIRVSRNQRLGLDGALGYGRVVLARVAHDADQFGAVRRPGRLPPDKASSG